MTAASIGRHFSNTGAGVLDCPQDTTALGRALGVRALVPQFVGDPNDDRSLGIVKECNWGAVEGGAVSTDSAVGSAYAFGIVHVHAPDAAGARSEFRPGSCFEDPEPDAQLGASAFLFFCHIASTDPDSPGPWAEAIFDVPGSPGNWGIKVVSVSDRPANHDQLREAIRRVIGVFGS